MQIKDKKYSTLHNVCAISSITWQGINYGIERLTESKKKEFLKKYLIEIQNNLKIIDCDSFCA